MSGHFSKFFPFYVDFKVGFKVGSNICFRKKKQILNYFEVIKYLNY